MKKVFTLCFIRKDGKVLLGMKKRGFGEGRWNGFGGKVEENETIEEAAKREFKEESNIDIVSLKEVGIIDFIFLNNGKELEVHIFDIEEYDGLPNETEEMMPKWFDENDIPFGEMWVDDPYWLPLLLEGKSFRGKFIFEDENVISDYELNIV
jgi:8-oxo-dGTP diphosphatase/2-hydroxy-dATP diphosphatase